MVERMVERRKTEMSALVISFKLLIQIPKQRKWLECLLMVSFVHCRTFLTM